MVNTEEQVLFAQVISHLPVELRQHLAARQLTGRLSKARDIVGLSRGTMMVYPLARVLDRVPRRQLGVEADHARQHIWFHSA